MPRWRTEKRLLESGGVVASGQTILSASLSEQRLILRAIHRYEAKTRLENAKQAEFSKRKMSASLAAKGGKS